MNSIRPDLFDSPRLSSHGNREWLCRFILLENFFQCQICCEFLKLGTEINLTQNCFYWDRESDRMKRANMEENYPPRLKSNLDLNLCLETPVEAGHGTPLSQRSSLILELYNCFFGSWELFSEQILPFFVISHWM